MISLSTVEKPNFESCDQLFHLSRLEKDRRWSWTTTRAYHHQPAIELVIHLGSRSKALMCRDVVKIWSKNPRLSLCFKQQAFPSQKTLHLHWFWYDLGGSFQGTPLLRGNHLWLKCFEACRWWGAHMPTQWERYGSDKDEWGRGERDSQLYQLGQFHGFQNFQSWDLIILEVGSFSIRIFVLLYQKDLKIFEAKIRLQV